MTEAGPFAGPGPEDAEPQPGGAPRRVRPTIHDVARHAGVSAMTVSRVLAGGVHVRPALQERVEAAIRAQGYRRNENARSIRPGQRTGVVGVSVANIANPYYAAMAAGIDEVMARHGRRTFVGNSAESPERERDLVGDFVSRSVEGLIVVAVGGPAPHLRPEALDGAPLVLASRAVPGVAGDTVLVADVTGARAATERLLAAGHRRIAFLGNASSVSTIARRLEGFRQAHAQVGLLPLAELVRDARDAAGAYDAVRTLLELPEPPTAVFCANNRITVGALRALARAARPGRPPVPVAAFDDVELSDLLAYPLTIVDHDAREMGHVAARLLLDRIDGSSEAMPQRVVEIGTTLVSLG